MKPYLKIPTIWRGKNLKRLKRDNRQYWVNCIIATRARINEKGKLLDKEKREGTYYAFLNSGKMFCCSHFKFVVTQFCFNSRLSQGTNVAIFSLETVCSDAVCRRVRKVYGGSGNGEFHRI